MLLLLKINRSDRFYPEEGGEGTRIKAECRLRLLESAWLACKMAIL